MNGSTKLRPPAAASYVGIAASTLAKLRCFGGGPRYSKISPRIVIYDRADLDTWLNERRYGSTREYDRRQPPAR